MNQLLDYYFWFAQPSSFLAPFDRIAGIIFAAIAALGLALLVVAKLAQNPVVKKLLNRFFHLAFWIGLGGVIWFGFRFEATPVFARRLWLGLVVVTGLIWLGWILYYLIFKFGPERQEFFNESIKQRYIPKSHK